MTKQKPKSKSKLKPKLKQKPQPPAPAPAPSTVAQSMRQACKEWGISTAVLRAAKAAGAPGFVAHRIHREDVEKWLAENPAVIADTESAIAEKGKLDALKIRKMAAQVAGLELANEKAKGLLILRAEAEESWAQCSAIVQEEAKMLMDRSMFGIFIARIQARLGKAIAESNAAAAAKLPA